MKHCYTSVMRFWLIWAVVTLPVVVCVSFWIRSYWVADYSFWGAENVAVAAGSSCGHVVLGTLTNPSKKLASHWRYERRQAEKYTSWTQPCVLGFGFERKSLPIGNSTTMQLPSWALTLLAGIGPLWLYRRQRKRRETGFPVEPVAASSKE